MFYATWKNENTIHSRLYADNDCEIFHSDTFSPMIDELTVIGFHVKGKT